MIYAVVMDIGVVCWVCGLGRMKVEREGGEDSVGMGDVGCHVS